MKFKLSIIALVGIMMSSCSLMEQIFPNTKYETAFGVITEVTPSGGLYFQILCDDGHLFNVVEYDTPQYQVESGQRVYFDYRIINDDAPVTEVGVRGFNTLLSGDIKLLSESNIEQLGSAAIRCSASFGGDYINLNYEYICNGGAGHNISLVYDDTVVEEGYIELYLYHNAATETGTLTNGTSTFGVASFRIAQLKREGETELHIRLHWSWWNSLGNLVEMSDTGTFIPMSVL